jgi:REP element-mobilizing transposase RayT
MANTFSQIHIQCVWSTAFRKKIINPLWEDEFHKYISGIIRNKKQKLLAINGMEDHLHLLIGMRPSCKLSEFVQEIKKSSCSFAQTNFKVHNFGWQEGYGAFSYCKKEVETVIQYLMNQKKHHATETFENEYIRLLVENEIEFDEKYVFD